MDGTSKISKPYKSFFNFMMNEHDLILTVSEMDEILSEALKLHEKLKQ